jgi:integrase
MKRAKRWVHPLDRTGGEAAELGPIGAVTPEPKAKLALVRTRREISDPYLETVLDFPRDRTVLLIDTDTDGLQCRLGAHRATWLFYHDDRRHGRRKITSKRLGFFPAMSTEQARDAARIERGRIAAGDLSPGKREAIKVEASVTAYIAHLESKIAKRNTKAVALGQPAKPARWAVNVRNYAKNHILPKWGNWTLSDLATHPGAVEDWHKDVTETAGEVTANHCCRVLRAAYRRSAKRDPSLPQRDPCSAVEYNSETPAQTAMAFRDFPKWLRALEKVEVGYKAPCRRLFHLWCVFTGTRPGEAARIRWCDVKPAKRVVEIPGAKAENVIRVIMSAPIARILKLARDAGKPKSREDFVFAHCYHAPHRDDLPAKGHALRHTYRTVSADAGVDDVIAHILQGWEPKNISETYVTRLVMAEGTGIRSAQRKVSSKIVKLLGRDPTIGSAT